jgi:hypothetical protein
VHKSSTNKRVCRTWIRWVSSPAYSPNECSARRTGRPLHRNPRRPQSRSAAAHFPTTGGKQEAVETFERHRWRGARCRVWRNRTYGSVVEYIEWRTWKAVHRSCPKLNSNWVKARRPKSGGNRGRLKAEPKPENPASEDVRSCPEALPPGRLRLPAQNLLGFWKCQAADAWDHPAEAA